MIYLVCFFASTLFAHWANKTKKRSTFIVLSIISIAITVTLAGLRDYSIGIDTEHYLTWTRFWAGAAKRETLLEYMKYYTSLGVGEYLFAFLLGIVEHYTGSFSLFLFVEHTIIITGVYIGAFRMKRHAAPELTLLLFYLLYYGSSLNITRQYIALTILFAAAADIENGKHLRYIFFTLIASLFHNSGIIGIAPLLLYRVLYPKKPLKNTTMSRKTVACTAIVGGTILFVPIVKLAIEIGILSQKYLYYFNGEKLSSYTFQLLFLTVEAMALVVFWKSFRKSNTRVDFYALCFVSFVALIVLGTTINYGKRIAAYFSLFNIVLLGMLVNGQELQSNRRIVRVVIVVAVLIYWAYAYVYRNASETMPYLPFFSL